LAARLDITVPLCNHRTNLPILKKARNLLNTRASAAIAAVTVAIVRLQLCQSSREICNWVMLLQSMRRCAVLIPVAFLALAIVWTWPLAVYLSSRIPHDPGDPILNIWLLWWNAHAVPFTERWWNPPIFYPMPGALALSEHLAGIGLVATPLQWFHASALSAYNVAFVLSFALSGYFTFLLVQRLIPASAAPDTRSIAGLCGALAYGFGPYRAGQLAHIQVLTSQWMPLALLAMHVYLASGKRLWLLVFVAAWIVQALSNGYYLLFFPVLVACWLAWFVDWRRAPARGVAIAMTWAGASLLLVPGLLHYADLQRRLGVGRSAEEMLIFSANLRSFFHASGMLALWRSSAARTTEDFLFPGVTSVVLVIAGCAAALRGRASLRGAQSGVLQEPHDRADARGDEARGFSRSPLVFYVGAAVILWALALGPAPSRSWMLILMHPYTWLAQLPGFNALRVPARFAMLATLCFAVAAGLGFARVAPRVSRLRWFVAGIAIAGLLADGWMREMPLATPPGRVIFPDVPQALLLSLPANDGNTDVTAMYRQTLHGRPIVNGYSGHTPSHYRILSVALRRGDPSAIAELAKGRPLVITVNQSLDGSGDLRRVVEGLPGVQVQGGSSAGAMYVVPAAASARTAPLGDPWPGVVRPDGRDGAERSFPDSSSERDRCRTRSSGPSAPRGRTPSRRAPPRTRRRVQRRYGTAR
jgi:hypothetical protein